MATSGWDFCTLCYDDGTSSKAVTWCPECEVFLCLDCEKHHKKLRISKDHKTISTEDYNKLPKFMREISSQCKDHLKKFELYCSFDDCPCCVQCLTDKHQKCQEMKSLSDILKEIKSSAFIHLTDKDLKDVKENFEEIIKFLNIRINATNVQNLKAIEEIRSMRKSINELLNRLEKEILNDLESKYSKMKSNMNTLLQQLKLQVYCVSHMQREFATITEYATELQMYVGLTEIKKNISQAENFIKDLESTDIFDEKNIEITISPTLKSFLEDAKSFGDININISPTTLHLKAGKEDQAQYVVPSIPCIEHINPSMLRTLTIPENMKSMGIIACRILLDGKYLILDYLNRNCHLLLFNNDGIFIRKVVTLLRSSCDACLVRNNTVAVTLGFTNKTALVDIEDNSIKAIKLSHKCDAVASDDKMLIICGESQSTIVNINDMSQRTPIGIQADFISLFQGNIYGTICDENIVRCYKITGELLWTFPCMHCDIVSPRGLAVDMHGFIYLSCYGNNNIVVVSPDDRTWKTILSDDDQMKYPWAIDINRDTGTMIVSGVMRDRNYDYDKGDSDSSDASDKSDEISYRTAFVYQI
ncbi:uncharacterized protein [Mytilus edulis]|uniref:uncharacterized protein n=1 Tax=Mytilus edulis TaxID=6550 RepID=UPI0039F01E93